MYELVGLGGTQELYMMRQVLSMAGRGGASSRGWLLRHIALQQARHELRRACWMLDGLETQHVAQQVHAWQRVSLRHLHQHRKNHAPVGEVRCRFGLLCGTDHLQCTSS